MKHLLSSILFICFIIASSSGQVASCFDELYVALSPAGAAVIPVSVYDEGSYDYDSLSASQTIFTCADLGVVDVVLSAYKGNNISTCTTTVMVTDQFSPILICQPDGAVVVPVVGGQATVTPAMVQQSVHENCTIVSSTLDQSVFNAGVGTATVELTVVDQSGNSASCRTVVQIGGVQPLYLNCQPDVQLGILSTASRVVELSDVLANGPYATWDLDLVITDSANNVVPNNELFGSQVGKNYTATVSDAVTGANCATTITIVEPHLVCVSNFELELKPWTNEVTVYAADLIQSATSFDSIWLSQSTFDCADLGPNLVTLYGKVGNTLYQCSSTVTISDPVLPVAICDQDIYIALDANGQANLSADLLDDGSYDNCGVDTITIDKTHFDTNSNPVEVVALTVTDISGNTNTCWVHVHILGAGTPSLTCRGDITIGLPISGSYTPNIRTLLDGGPFYGWDINYFLLDENNDTIPNNLITLAHLNTDITFIVFDNNSSNSCFGNIFVDGSIPSDCSSFFICDNKPWNTPLGGCASGHSQEDFVEWPGNIEINSCYYSPNYLETFTTVDWRNVRPLLYGDCSSIDMTYEDVVFTLPDDEIKVLRTWTVVDWLSTNLYNYTQVLFVDMANCATPVVVRNKLNDGIAGVNIYETVFTNEEGEASIHDNRYNSLSAKLTGTIRDGVDIHDALAVQEYINGQRSLDALQLRLADTDQDEVVDMKDVQEIRNIAFEVYDPLTPEPWLFYGAKSNPVRELNRPVAAGDYYGGPVEIIGAKRGDIDGSATNDGQLDNANNTIDIDLYVKDELLFEAVNYTVDFSIDDLENIGGQQLELVIDLNKVDIRNVSSPAFPDFSENDYKITHDNILLIYWRATNNVILNGGASAIRDIPILSIDLVAKQNSILSTAISLNQNNRNSIARVGDNHRYQFNLSWVDKIISNTINTGVDTRQVVVAPNPANDMIVFSIENGTSNELVLDIFNSLGQRVEQHDIVNGTIQLSTSSWNQGIYFYNITSVSGLKKSGMFSILH